MVMYVTGPRAGLPAEAFWNPLEGIGTALGDAARVARTFTSPKGAGGVVLGVGSVAVAFGVVTAPSRNSLMYGLPISTAMSLGAYVLLRSAWNDTGPEKSALTAIGKPVMNVEV